jgi:hypothetical protein
LTLLYADVITLGAVLLLLTKELCKAPYAEAIWLNLYDLVNLSIDY